jgi:hypothetical protein
MHGLLVLGMKINSLKTWCQTFHKGKLGSLMQTIHVLSMANFAQGAC